MARKSLYITPEDFEEAEANGINREALGQRVRQYGWSIERAKTEPIREKLFYHGNWLSVALKNGIKSETFYARINRGWDDERAATEPVAKRNKSRKER